MFPMEVLVEIKNKAIPSPGNAIASFAQKCDNLNYTHTL